MKKMFVVLAWRNFKRRRFYAMLELGGLALGLSCFLMVAIYLVQEMKFDQDVNNSGDIYRIVFNNNEGRRYSGIPSALAYHIKREVPQVDDAIRVFWPWSMFTQNEFVQHNDRRFYEQKLLVADSTFFKMFEFRFLEGSPRQALQKKNAVVINESTKKKYFGDATALGQSLQMGTNQFLTVTGVVADNRNTHLDFNFLQPIQSYPDWEYTWAYTLAFTYVRVGDHQNIPAIQSQLFQLVMLHATDENAEYLKNFHYRLQPFGEIHSSVLDWDIITPTSTQQLLAVGLIATFILLLAIVNFINLSTARFSERMREMGVNAVLGAGNNTLVIKVMTECAMMILFAFIVGLILTIGCLPFLSSVIGTPLDAGNLVTPELIIVEAVLLMVVLLLAAIFPIARLSSFKSVDVLKSKVVTGLVEHRFRRALVVFQFTIAGALIAATLIITAQVDYLQSISVGFDKERIVVLRMRSNANRFDQLRNRLLSHADILGVAGASTAMGLGTGTDTFSPVHLQPQGNNTFANTISIDENFLEVMNIPLVLGRNFEGVAGGELRTSYIVNETALAQYQIADPIGARLLRRDDREGKIIGVVKDFYFGSTSNRINAIVMNVDSVYSHQYMLIKVKANMQAVVRFLEREWNQVIPEQPMELGFQDDYLNRLYQKDRETKEMVSTFAAISIAIALLSLLGLSSFMVSKRTKEIGIRKVMGARTTQILTMLCIDFLKLVILAVLISVPFTWYVLDSWLQNYMNRISLHPLYFIASGFATVLLALLVVSVQSFRAAISNPVNAIRSE